LLKDEAYIKAEELIKKSKDSNIYEKILVSVAAESVKDCNEILDSINVNELSKNEINARYDFLVLSWFYRDRLLKQLIKDFELNEKTITSIFKNHVSTLTKTLEKLETDSKKEIRPDYFI
jgi:hypothetical protein